MTLNEVANDRLISLPEVKLRTGKSRSGIYAAMRTEPPEFPRAIKDGFASRWLESEITRWIARRISERDRAISAKGNRR